MLTKTQKLTIYYAGADDMNTNKILAEKAFDYVKVMELEPEDMQDAIELYCDGFLGNKENCPKLSDTERRFQELVLLLENVELTEKTYLSIKKKLKNIK